MINKMNLEYYIVHITVHQKENNLNHPMNDFGSSKSSGTGFYIEPGVILTCHHVVENSLSITVKTYDQNNEIFDNKAHIKYMFPDDDLAIIEVENKNIIYNIFEYHILTEKINNLEVNTVGFPLNSITLKINKGIISGFQESNIQTDSTLNPGNSGGPLLYNNKVIGINKSRLLYASNTGFATPIFRFLILYKLKKHDLRLINYKPNLLFLFQNNKQKFHNFNYGVRISEMHKKSCFKNKIEIDDILLKINGHKIDNEGKIKFPFFPEKINLTDVNLWFTNGDNIVLTYYSNKQNKIIDSIVQLKFHETNLLKYHIELDRKYFFENNGLVFSIFTNYHIDNLDELKMPSMKKIKLLSKFLTINDVFVVYLSDLIHSKLKFSEYPINDIITHINDIEIINYDTLVKVMRNPVTKIKTVDNHVFFVEL